MGSHILLIDCKDRPGLVSQITGVLYARDCNIIENHEFVEEETGRFFMRTEFSGDIQDTIITRELYAVLPEGVSITLTRNVQKKIVIMATKEHHCLGELLIRFYFGELNARILAVISNHEDLKELVDKFEIPYHYITHNNKTRDEHESEILYALSPYRPDYIILAKYMRVLSGDFISRYQNRAINIHHSFLPAFIGANPYRQAFERGVKIIGATAHFANETLDEGPIITQSTIPVDHTHTAEDMARAGHDIEKQVLAQALKLVFEDRVFVSNNKTIIFD